MYRVLKWIVYGPGYEANKRRTAECVRRRETAQSWEVRENPVLKSLECKMKIADVLLLWIWRAWTATVVLALVVMLLGGCCSTQQIKGGDLTPENDCPLIQAGFAALDQLPRILK